ncbi:NAD(P) transhydrogenase subunit alpha [Actinobacteria bacterium YIM 96077]|uniref:proton-translocating NAD(P)(+) transhydrogenase n=1 Tax=Phytoactinopolyspora halophila TaxID=1981511 RepID=A0A329QBS2_9ACTN|nr:NAD(P) transhydrogenase subunit alpha [Phytoactinopolyspora halophila]AYY11834.1 NAD(P) transhydrogenase subunit alpha [Actinobacteria bacterium YIM 96077]RAW09855.1 NAD(P)(+) transhydrogenase (Re/Si-specific) subunit alpha [Phytoactinopolyspora halophila]
MKVAVVRELWEHERRVAMVPDLVGKLTGAGLDVVVESGAGEPALHSDEEYTAAGASIAQGSALDDADIVFSVQPLGPDRIAALKPGAITVSFLPLDERETIRAARDAGVTAFSVELVPRISRAQSMDALTSQALVAGYHAVLTAAERLPRFFPLSMTAAGTIPPAEVLVLGAGVAGLQAIATARRLGARVQAYDVRAAAADEIRSLGARFVELDLPTLDGTGGYAREMTEERAQQQRDLLAPYVTGSDVLITTAAVPGRTAPLLVERSTVERMKPGSVVVDIAAETGGNVEGSIPGEEINVGGALLCGGRNVPSQVPVHASRLYASNLVNLLLLMTHEGDVSVDLDDEIIAGVCVTHDGTVRNSHARELLGEAD